MQSTPQFFRNFLIYSLLFSLIGLSACSRRDAPNGGEMEANPAPAALPRATAVCPDFHEGMNIFSQNGVTRAVQLYLDPITVKELDGPLIFYWYGTAGQPSQALDGLGIEGVNKIKALGGIVAAATHINQGAFPWINGPTAKEFALMDEVLACAIQKVGIDIRHIHAMGFSAGALLAAQAGYARSRYLASVVTYSGGARNAASQDPDNLFPAMIFYGGVNDRALLNFQTTSLQYAEGLVKNGHVVVLCNHATGHRLPSEAAPAALQFLLDHPFRRNPEPYLKALPAGSPKYCTM